MKVKETIPFLGTTAIVSILYIIILHIFSGANNILVYAAVCSLFCIISFLLCFLWLKVGDKIQILKSNFSFGYMIFIDLLFAVWFVFSYFLEDRIFDFNVDHSLRHRIFPALYFGSIVLTFAALILLLKQINKENGKLRIVFAIIVALIQTAVLFAPNIMNDQGGTLFHIHAYFNPVYNTSDFRPVNEIIRSIYGNYSFFYIIPMNFLKLFGISKVYSSMIINGIIGLASFILLYLGLNRLIKRDILYIFSILSVSYISFYYFQSGQYYQVLPHRIVAVCALVFMLSFGKKIGTIGLLTYSSLAILWNFETGLVCSFSLALFEFLYCENDNYKKTIKNAAVNFGIFIASNLISYLFFNLFNLLLGGNFLSYKAFIFPIASDEYVINELSVPLPGLHSLYYIEFVLFIIVFVYCAFRFVRKKSFEKILFSLAVLGLGLSPYFINRPVYANISIVHIPFVILLVLFFQTIFDENTFADKKIWNGAVFYFIPVILFSFFILGAVSGIPLTVINRLNTSWNYKDYENFKIVFENAIPDDVAAAGPGLPDVYSTMGRDPQIYIMDWSDWSCSEKVIEYAVDDINSKDSLVFNNSTGIADYIDLEDWILVNFLYNEFYYIVKIDPNLGGRKENIINYALTNNYSETEFVDLCFLDFYKTLPDDGIREYYFTDYSDCDMGELYDIMYEDYLYMMNE